MEVRGRIGVDIRRLRIPNPGVLHTLHSGVRARAREEVHTFFYFYLFILLLLDVGRWTLDVGGLLVRCCHPVPFTNTNTNNLNPNPGMSMSPSSPSSSLLSYLRSITHLFIYWIRKSHRRVLSLFHIS